MKQVSVMINFSAISNRANIYSLSTGVQAQAKQTEATKAQTQIVSAGNYELSNNVAAMKSQVAASSINFNQNFLKNIQYLNAQAAVGMHKQVDGKIFVSTDAFKSEPTEFLKSATLSQKLEYIDNLSKDKEGSNGLMYFKNENNEQNSGSKLNLLYA